MARAQQDERAVFVHADDDGAGHVRRHRGRLPAARQPLAAQLGGAARGLARLVVLDQLRRALQALLIAGHFDDLARGRDAALADAVDAAHVERGHAHFLGDHVDVLLDGKVDFAHAKAAVRAAHGMVGIHAVAVRADVLDIVRADAAPAGRLDDVDAVLGVRAAIPRQRVLGTDDLAVLAHGGLDADVQPLAHIGILELVLARVGQLDRAARTTHGQRNDDAFERGAGLAAEAAAHRLADDADLVQREVERLRQRAPHRKRRLARRPDRQLAIRHVLRGAGVRLDGHVLHVRDVEAVVKHAVRLRKRAVRVALAQDVVVRDVRPLFGIEDGQHLVGVQVRMDERRIRLHAVQRVEHRRQLLILHLDEPAGLFCDLKALGRHSRDRLATELGRADGQEVFVLQIQAAALFIALAGDHAAHALERLRLGGVDGQDLRVRIRAALHLRIQRARETDIVGKLRGTRDFLDGIQPFYGLTDYLHFSYTPLAATSSMASTIFL